MEQKTVWPEIPAFDLEEFMKSITYPPEGMTANLARREVMAEEKAAGKTESIPEREVRILQRALDELPIGIAKDDLLAGNYGPAYATGELMARIEEANREEYAYSEEYQVKGEAEAIASGRYMLFGIYTPSHTCIEYGKIIRVGLEGYLAAISGETDEFGEAYRAAMGHAAQVVQGFSARYAALALEQMNTSTDEADRARLGRMAEALKRVPMKPARDFFEALQSMWIVHTALPTAERSWASVSLGRMDHYLMDYYTAWLESGHSREEAKALLIDFFKLLNRYGDGSNALNLGPDYTELSNLLLEIEKEGDYCSPIFATRLSKDTPPQVWEELIDKRLFQKGQPTFYNEDACVRAMEYRGVTAEDGFVINSCMGMIVPGREIADMWGCCVNMNLPLELAVNGGRPLHGELPETVKRYTDRVTPEAPDNMEAVKRSYAAYLDALVHYVAKENQKRAAWVSVNRPNPLLSLVTEDCGRYGRDRAHSAFHALGEEARGLAAEAGLPFETYRKGRGAKYHNVTVLSMGFAHAADAMCAMDQLVFKEKRYRLAELLEAARENFERSGKAQEIARALENCGKYADGTDRADYWAAFVLDALADACENCYTGNIRYLPTCHTIDANVKFGSCVYASLDGRKDGEAYGKNAGPVMSVIRNAPTNLVLAAGELPQERFSGGVPIDIYVPGVLLEDKEYKDKFKGLMAVYFRRGGMQVQVNSVSLELLKKAYASPEEYGHVIVRKGGFSLYFTSMDRPVQLDMIQRFEREMGA